MTEPVSLDLAKLHCRVESDDDSTLVSAMISAARKKFEDSTGLKLITQTVVEKFDEFPDEFRPLWAPLIAVAITYTDGNGAVQTLAAAHYQVDVGNDATPGRVKPVSGECWPDTHEDTYNAVMLTYTAGYGADESSVPVLIKQAILLQVAKWYQNREDYEEKRTMSAFESICSQFKVNKC